MNENSREEQGEAVMHQVRTARWELLHFVVGTLLMSAVPINLSAQNPNPATPEGWNAAVQSSGPLTPSPSYAIVDATQFQVKGSDLCATINTVFNDYYPTVGAANGIVVDARGVSGLALQCTSGTNPWFNLISKETTNQNYAFTNIVLLPAGTITIQATWKLPPYTHLIGQGPNSTVIAATSSFSDMIEMGQENPATNYPCLVVKNSNNTWDCPGIVIEHLGLVGYGTGTSGTAFGIVNCCAQELSRVNDVSISNVKTGLALTDQFAQNSGPYTNLTISGVNTCLSIGPAMSGNMMVNSRGVHGLTCSVIANNTPAITIDGPNNTLEDISISTSASGVDGIFIGSQKPAEGNTLFNIQGSGLKSVIHISGANVSNNVSGPQNCPYAIVSGSNIVYNVCDLTVFGVARSGGTNTIQDELTNTTILDSTLAMYTLGEIVLNSTNSNYTNSIGYSRFTTATASGNVAAWLVGSTDPSSSCAVGTLYSCTSSSCAGALYECVGGSTNWTKIK
jgi:hypothetical protein